MVNFCNTDKEILTEYHSDAMLWNSRIGYIENDIQFINRLLHTKAFKETTPNLFEHIQNFEHEIKTKNREVKNFKKEINEYEVGLKGILECEDISSDTF